MRLKVLDAVKNLTTPLFLSALLAGVVLTIWELVHLSWPETLPWTDASARFRYLAFMGVCAGLVVAGSFWSKRNPLLVGAIIATGLALLAGALWPILVTLWFAFASAILGRSILAVLKINTGGGWLTHFLVGAGVYGTAVGLLAHFPVNYPGVYGVALALPVLLGWRNVAEFGRSFMASLAKNDTAGFKINWLDTSIAVIALVYFVVALMPEVGYDALAMHLFIPAHLALRHQWGFDASTYVWAVMPMLGDWIFSIGYMLDGETAVRLINAGFILVLAWLVRDLVLWAGGSTRGASWAALIFLSTPLTFTEGSSLFIESVWASFAVAGTLAILRACSASGRPGYELPLAGLLLGCALAAKAVTFTILLVLLLLLVWRYRAWRREGWPGTAALGLALFLAAGSIPYVTAWLSTGNPVFPFFNHIFKSEYYPTGVANFGEVFSQGLSWDTPYRVIFESERYLEATTGAAGFQWLLLLLPASVAIFAERRKRAMALLLIGVVSIALTFHSAAYLRYVFPAWAILAAVIGVGMDRFRSCGGPLGNLGYAAAVATVGLNLAFLGAGSFHRDFALNSVVDDVGRERYLSDHAPIRSAVGLVNRLNPGMFPVAVFGHPLAAGLAGDALYPSWYNVSFQREISSIHSEQDAVDVLLRRGVNFFILDTAWNGVNCCVGGAEKQAFIENVSETVAEFGGLGVRKVKTEYRYKTELLDDADFASGRGWVVAPGVQYDAGAGIFLVSAKASAFQKVRAAPGGLYLNTVIARCAKEPTLGRVQINWLDAGGRLARADIKTFKCTDDWVEHTMEVSAPLNARDAVIYTTGHTSTPLAFKSNSLRQ